MEVSRKTGALVDGHVHLHSCFDIADALDAAVKNFGDVRSSLGLHRTAPAVIWLAEHDEEGSTDRLTAAVEAADRWRLIGSEGPTLKIRSTEDGADLTVILGQQIRTREDLEILVVGAAKRTPAGLTLTESIDASLAPDSLVMIPWGFGKWTGARGNLVMQAYDTYADEGLRLADTGAYSRIRRTPPAFRRSRRDEAPVLAGSDPFPFPGQHVCIGKTGFVAEGVQSDVTWPGLLRAIRSLRGEPCRFGRPLGILDFVALQARMQARKRWGGVRRVE